MYPQLSSSVQVVTRKKIQTLQSTCYMNQEPP